VSNTELVTAGVLAACFERVALMTLKSALCIQRRLRRPEDATRYNGVVRGPWRSHSTHGLISTHPPAGVNSKRTAASRSCRLGCR
jgi:hypothetical protein